MVQTSIYLIQLSFGVFFNSSNIFHCEAVPLVKPTYHLPMEPRENPVVGLKQKFK